MARPLTRVSRTGDLYTRPAAIETAIDAALALDLATLERRAAITDPNSAEYIPSECLVHLIRENRRHANAQGRDGLLYILLQRCTGNLARNVPDGRVPNAAYVRDEALGRLGELFAEDGIGDNADELDYYEVRFNGAFAALRTDLIRAEFRTVGRFEQLPEEDHDEDQSIGRLADALKKPATQENAKLLQEVFAAINKLPPTERDAVTLCYIMGYEVESEDPAKITAATLRGVTGRTIRNRLRRANATLKQCKEGL